MTTAELQAELEKRQAEAEKQPQGPDELQPDLKNPHSERLKYVEGAHQQKKESGEEGKRLAAATTASMGPSVPSLGAPGNSSRTELGAFQDELNDDDEDEDDEDEGLSPEDYASADTETTNKELRAEIARRNDEREEAGLEALSLDGNKADLVATLQRDDEERAEEQE
jgi:hypothetical protein